MSLVYITYHSENVHDLDKENGEEKPQHFKYKSKFREIVQKEVRQPRLIVTADGKKLLAPSGKYEHRTMGYLKTPLNAPTEFMRKNHGVKWLRIHDHDHVCSKATNLPPIPRRPSTGISPIAMSNQCEQNSTCQCAGKPARANFIALNIERVKHLKPKYPNPRYIDTAQGDRHELLNTGLIPQYVYGKNFGRVPCYLQAQKNYQKRVQDICSKERPTFIQSRDYLSMFGTRKLLDEERETLLEGLKTNFLEQSKTFQKLSLFTDTLAKKLRKARIENTLRQLEQDIYLLEKNPIIYVSNY